MYYQDFINIDDDLGCHRRVVFSDLFIFYPNFIQNLVVNCPTSTEPNANSIPVIMHENAEKNNINDETKRQSRSRISRMLRAIIAYYTATMLVWCTLTKLHTDPIDWNRMMHLSMGNRPGKVKDSLDVMYQNLPGVLGVVTLGTQLDSIVKRLNPDVLFVGEADGDNVKAACPNGYVWVGGTLKSKKELIRVSALVRNNIPFKTFKVDTKVPAVGLKVGEWKLVGIYREWALCGDQDTKSKDQQIDRLKNFVDYWLKLKGKSICIGDYIDPFPGTEYQGVWSQLEHVLMKLFFQLAGDS